ncbi:hypothetical protein B0H14DRAFT_3871536 [Mycena olivaceomarginata]|nr:hypothetical protein B0H14DRAFT_3871536 [Mycena olivaceomarginata]
MVLTRSAARAHNSIIRWLPNEILSAVISEASIPDLVVLCRTSRLICKIATPILYRVISLSTVAQIEDFIQTMILRSGLSCHVREFSFEYEVPNLALTSHLVESITAVLFQFRHLECLDLLRNQSIEFTDMLHHAHFPNLRAFRYCVQSDDSAPLVAFLNRHPTITELALNKSGPFEHLAPIHLPNLECYTGTNSFIIAFDLHSRSIRRARLFWHATDEDVDTALLHLGSAGSLHAITVIFPSTDFKERHFLRAMATHLPHVKSIGFWNACGGFPSREDTLEITTHLKEFGALSFLGFYAAEVEHNPNDEREIVLAWSAACKTLVSVYLNGRRWTPAEGHWADEPYRI